MSGTTRIGWCLTLFVVINHTASTKNHTVSTKKGTASTKNRTVSTKKGRALTKNYTGSTNGKTCQAPSNFVGRLLARFFIFDLSP